MDKLAALKAIDELKEVVNKGEILVLNHKTFTGIGVFLLSIAILKLFSSLLGELLNTDPQSVFQYGKSILALSYLLLFYRFTSKDVLIATGRMKLADQIGTSLGISIILLGSLLAANGYTKLLLPVTMCLLGNMFVIYGIFSSAKLKVLGWALISFCFFDLLFIRFFSADLFIIELLVIAGAMLMVGAISKADKTKVELVHK